MTIDSSQGEPRRIPDYNLNVLASQIYTINEKKGFWEENRNFGEAIALVTSELSEALEAHRDGEPATYIKDGKPEGVAVELIDAMIRLFDMLEGMYPQVDIDHWMQLKLIYNSSRPPKHGKAY